MTSLAAWIGVDSRGPSSLNIASDSRITWPGGAHWDHGRKLFACSRLPHILGYCGDVLFPTQILGQLAEMIDSGLVLPDRADPEKWTAQIADALVRSFRTYPAEARQAFHVLHGMRIGEGMSSTFVLQQISVSPDGALRTASIDVPHRSAVVAILGSGAGSLKAHLGRWQKSEVKETSRAVFSGFCDSLKSGDDARSGGPPQLVGLWRRERAKTFGIIWEGRRYFYGSEIGPLLGEEVRWYNAL